MRNRVVLFEGYGWPEMSKDEWTDHYYDRYRQAEQDELLGFAKWLRSGRPESMRQGWDLVNVFPLRGIWKYYVEVGHVYERHYKTLRAALELTVANAALLDFNMECYNMALDSSQYDDFDITREELDEHYVEYATNPETGQARFTDYGLKPVQEALYSAFEDGTPEGALRGLDRAFNVIHMQSDLSAMFVWGGSGALSELSGIER